MEIKWRQASPSFLDEVEMKRIEKAMALLNFESCSAIESYTMSPDGPTVSSVFIVTDDYLCEVHLTSKYDEFDVSAARSVINYRVKFGESMEGANADSAVAPSASPTVAQDVVSDSDSPMQHSPAPRKIKFVEIQILHTDSLRSTLSCFGEDIDDWLTHFCEVYPKKFLLK